MYSLKKQNCPLPIGRQRLATVVYNSGDLISIDDVVRTLDFNRTKASKLLSRWNQQGWMRRIGPGLYVPVNYPSLGEELVLDNPWFLVPSLFEPAYVGFRSALEFWNLIEQEYKDTVVMTTRPVRNKQQVHHNFRYAVKHISGNKMFGAVMIRIGRLKRTKVLISDMERTIVDILDDPCFAGGISVISECIFNYTKQIDRDYEKLIAYADKLGNGAVFKRLGYLLEPAPETEDIVEACRYRLTQGYIKVDPQISDYHLVTRWRLLVPRPWKEQHPYNSLH